MLCIHTTRENKKNKSSGGKINLKCGKKFKYDGELVFEFELNGGEKPNF